MRASLPAETKIKLFGPKLLPGHGDLVERRVMKVLIEKIDLIENTLKPILIVKTITSMSFG